MAVTESGQRVRPAVRRAGIIAVIVLLPMALWSAWDYVEARRFARLVGSIKARGEPISTYRPTDPRVDSADNAARYYDAAGALLDRQDLYGLGGIAQGFRDGTTDRAALMARTRTWLDRNGEAERLLALGGAREFLGYRPGTEYNYRTDRMAGLGVLAGFRAYERANAGDGDGAARALIEAVKAARAIELRTFNFRSHAVFRALRNLDPVLAARPGIAALGDLQAAFQEHDRDAAIEDATLASRAYLIENFWDDARQWYARSALRANSVAEAVTRLVMRPWAANRLYAELTRVNAFVEKARRPWPERLLLDERPRAAERTPSGAFRQRDAFRIIADTIPSEAQGLGRTIARVRSACAAIAIERFRASGGGIPPTALADLVPTYLPAVPVDPFSGEPIMYVRRPDGYVVYSLGRDLKDDGGAVEGDAGPWGSLDMERSGQPADLGFRVTLSEERTR
jgi:hypothetical protein